MIDRNRTKRAVPGVLVGVLLLLAVGCGEIPRMGAPAPRPTPQPAPPQEVKQPSPEQIDLAFTRLNTAFQKEYERILSERGTRRFPVRAATAYDALYAALVRLGMIVEDRDAFAGTLTVAAPAPRPLSLQEWRQTVQSDLPMMASILCPVLGPYCKTLTFAPDDYVIVINATVLPTRSGGAEVALTTRMREIVPRPGTPRRDYPPPTGVRMALDKIWTHFDQALADRAGSSKRAR